MFDAPRAGLQHGRLRRLTNALRSAKGRITSENVAALIDPELKFCQPETSMKHRLVQPAFQHSNVPVAAVQPAVTEDALWVVAAAVIELSGDRRWVSAWACRGSSMAPRRQSDVFNEFRAPISSRPDGC